MWERCQYKYKFLEKRGKSELVSCPFCFLPSQILEQTGCNIIAIYDQGKMYINPDSAFCLGENNELILIGTGEAERQFFQKHSKMSKID